MLFVVHFGDKAIQQTQHTVQSLDIGNYLRKCELLTWRYLTLDTGNQSDETEHKCGDSANILRNAAAALNRQRNAEYRQHEHGYEYGSQSIARHFVDGDNEVVVLEVGFELIQF